MAAQAAGVDERTVRRWKKRPVFHAELQARAAEILDATSHRLMMAMSNAPLVVHRMMMDKQTPDAVKLAAARIILDSGLKMMAYQDQEARIQDALERLGRLEEQQQEGRHAKQAERVRTWP
jgi:hypothetical protein